MPHRILLKKIFLLQLMLLVFFVSKSQCPGGYTAAQLNWDNLDYYWNSGSGNTPYNTYISDATEQTQRFSIGTTYVTMVTNNADMVNPGAGNSAENATHTGEIANYTGQDVQFDPGGNNRTITITFATAVSAPNFTLYDIDDGAVFSITATSNLSLPTPVTVTTYAGTILAVGGIFPLPRTITAGAGNLANNLNTGSATVSVAGLVNSITITVTTRGSDPVFWLSDINTCTLGTFPTNWHQGANNRPFWGPTQSQPDYFLITPDNNSCYYVDPATGVSRLLLTDAARTYVNSFGYDPYNRFLYYISENSSVDANNKQIKRYNYNTETSSVIIADISAAPLNIPTFNSGVESAGCAFYNGSLYFGIEGGTYQPGGSSTLRTRETIIWKIDFDASNNPTTACQVFAIDAATNGSGSISTHDWGDFIIRNGIIYDFNTARNNPGPSYAQSKYHHYNMMTGNMDATYNNPGTTTWNGQSGMGWSGTLYFFRPSTGSNSVVGVYNENGTNGATQTITVASGPAWPGGSGDASDPFRPKCDFGDAPATYDPYVTPATQSPAVHERSENIRLGATWDYEFLKRGVAGTDDVDDGTSFVSFLPQGHGNYLAHTYVTNNSGAAATLIAWLDYNANGVFDASEAITPINIPNGTNNVMYWLYWPSFTSPLINGQSTYMRVRITSAAAGMTSAHATGYFTNGEVEDYRIPVDDFPLAVNNLSFNASLINNSYVKLNWSGKEESNFSGYEVQKSKDAVNWEFAGVIPGNGQSGTKQYEFTDNSPYAGLTYYRLKFVGASGNNSFSEVRSVKKSALEDRITIKPNPVTTNATISINVTESTTGEVVLIASGGKRLHSQKIVLNAGANTIQFPIKDDWNAGMYILRVIINEEIINKKLIIHK